MGVLDNQVAVITGSSRGLGLAIARAYAAAGAAVVLSARTASTVEQAAAELKTQGARASGLACDVADMAQVRALRDHALATFGRLDIWVNNAGTSGPFGPTAHISVEAFARVLHTNIFGVYYSSMAALEHFVPQRCGKLINLLGRGDKGFAAYQNAYAPTRAWVRSFTLALAKEYEASGIGIHAFNPGLVNTDLLRQIDAVQGYEARLNPLKTAIRLWANPPQIPAQRALWLASPATDGKTGLEVKVLKFPHILGGMLRDFGRRLARRQGEEVTLTITSLPPRLPTEPLSG